MSRELKSVLMIAEHRALKGCLLPHIDQKRENISWESMGYAGLSGGQQTAISWAYVIWRGNLPPAELNFRDPFDGFGSLDRDLQQTILTAFAFFHGTYEEPGGLEKYLLNKQKEIDEENKKH